MVAGLIICPVNIYNLIQNTISDERICFLVAGSFVL